MLALKSDCLLLEEQFEKSLVCYTNVCKIYNLNLRNSEYDKENYPISMPAEAFCFGVDEYIKLYYGMAECLFHLGKFEQAVDKFEGVKKRIAAEIVFDKPVMLLNTHSQLGNCYLKLGRLNEAKNNFE